MERRPTGAENPRMLRRIVALGLWAYFAWYLAAMIASYIGATHVAGPVAAVLTLAVGIVGWARTASRVTPAPAESALR